MGSIWNDLSTLFTIKIKPIGHKAKESVKVQAVVKLKQIFGSKKIFWENEICSDLMNLVKFILYDFKTSKCISFSNSALNYFSSIASWKCFFASWGFQEVGPLPVSYISWKLVVVWIMAISIIRLFRSFEKFQDAGYSHLV